MARALGSSVSNAERARLRREQADATRSLLLRSAREVFEEQGYKAASVNAITARAETAHGTFYLYFKNKQDAFIQVLADINGQLHVEAEASWQGDRRASAAKATAGFLGVFVLHAGLWRALLEAILLDPAIEQMWADMRRTFAERVARNIEREQQAGMVRPFDARNAGYALASMVEWYAFTHFVMEGPPTSPDALGEAVELLTDLWIHAVYGDRLDD
ncbi:MAG TPA: TetR/AcrR family transcriptional regulator [Acidimicrobiales bacterium]